MRPPMYSVSASATTATSINLATALCRNISGRSFSSISVLAATFSAMACCSLRLYFPVREQALTSAIPLMNSSTRSTTAVSLAIFFWVVCREARRSRQLKKK